MRTRVSLLLGVLLMSTMAGCSAGGDSTSNPTPGPCPASCTTTNPDPDNNEIADLPGRSDSYFDVFPAFEVFTVSGTGNEIVDLPAETWAGTVSATISEASQASIWSIDSTGTPIDTLINTTGPYTGTTAYGLDYVKNTTGLTIQTQGSWTLTISSLQDADQATIPTSGNGDAVFWRVGQDDIFDAKFLVDVEFPGDSNFAIITYPDIAWPETKINFDPTYSVSEVVPGNRESQTVTFTSLDSLVVINSAGPWTVALTP